MVVAYSSIAVLARVVLKSVVLPIMNFHTYASPFGMYWGPPRSKPLAKSYVMRLEQQDLEWCAWPLSNLGVSHPDDLDYLQDCDLMLHLGVTLVQCRKIRAALSTPSTKLGTPPQAAQSSHGAVKCGKEDTTTAEMARAAGEAADAAFRAVADSMRLAKDERVKRLFSYTQEQLSGEAGNSPRGAARALVAVTRALASCSCRQLRPALAHVQQNLRGNLIWQTQLGAPLGDRSRFISLLEQALELAAGCLEQKHLHWENKDSQMVQLYAQLMHSYRKTVRSTFPDAFLSNTERRVLKNGRPRNKRIRPAKGEDASDIEDTCPGPEQGLSSIAVSAMQDMVVEPPPGLDPPSICGGSEADVLPQFSLTSGRFVEARRGAAGGGGLC